MTIEIGRFDRANGELQGAIFSGSVLKATQMAVKAYSEGTKDFFERTGFENKFEGVAMAVGVPVCLPLLVSASITAAVISKIGNEIDSKKDSK